MALRSSNMDIILASDLLLLSSTEEMKRRPPTEKRSKKVTLFNVTILLIPNPGSEALIPETSFVNSTLGLAPPDYSGVIESIGNGTANEELGR